jgi:type III secretion system YscD/HrpQ family protein
VVVDQYIWQEINTLIAKNPAWVGITVHAYKPGQFAVTGYLKTRHEAALLQDFLYLNFPYLDRLQNRVATEEDLLMRLRNDLFSHGMPLVEVEINNGEVALMGSIEQTDAVELTQLIKEWKKLPGIRLIKNFTLVVAPSDAVINLSDRYKVSGFSSRDNKSLNVVINGRILTVGDSLDGMTIRAIEGSVIYLEKDGLKYKIEYNP